MTFLSTSLPLGHLHPVLNYVCEFTFTEFLCSTSRASEPAAVTISHGPLLLCLHLHFIRIPSVIACFLVPFYLYQLIPL